jgi:hypothetical protein
VTRDEWLGLQEILALVDELMRELIGNAVRLKFTGEQQAQLWTIHRAVAVCLDEAAAVVGGTP